MLHKLLPRVVSVAKQIPDLSGHLISMAGAGWALVGAIDANTVQLWGGVAVALLAAFWGHIREQKRRDFDDAERRKLLKVLVDANAAAASAGQPLPYPEVVTMLVSGPGVAETKEPASAS